jgi:hypothetical protein
MARPVPAELTVDVDRPGLEVEIRSAETERLADPETCEQHDCDDRAHLVPQLREQGIRFAPRQVARL